MRLTEELPMGSYRAKTIYLEPHRNEQECIYKLGQLEDIEDELGIDLITFFKIYNTDKVYIKGKDYYWKIKHYNRHSITVGTNKTIYLPLKDYGKTWALTKEELL